MSNPFLSIDALSLMAERANSPKFPGFHGHVHDVFVLIQAIPLEVVFRFDCLHFTERSFRNIISNVSVFVSTFWIRTNCSCDNELIAIITNELVIPLPQFTPAIGAGVFTQHQDLPIQYILQARLLHYQLGRRSPGGCVHHPQQYGWLQLSAANDP